jgi:CHAD domain-containing protein
MLLAKPERRRLDSELRLVEALPKLALRPEFATPAFAPKPPADAISDAVIRLLKRSAKMEDPSGLHRLRIAAKKLRYTLELLAPGHPRLEQIKRLQSLLGDINDYETARHMIIEECGAKTLASQLENRQRRKIREFRRYWKSDFDRSGDPRPWVTATPHARKSAAA